MVTPVAGTPSTIVTPPFRGASGQRHGHVHGVGPALVGHVEPTDDIVGSEHGPECGDLGGREFMVLNPESVDELRLATERIHPVRIRGDGDVTHGAESGRQSGLLLEPLVEVP